MGPDRFSPKARKFGVTKKTCYTVVQRVGISGNQFQSNNQIKKGFHCLWTNYITNFQGRRKQISFGPAAQNIRNMTSCQIVNCRAGVFHGRGWPPKFFQIITI